MNHQHIALQLEKKYNECAMNKIFTYLAFFLVLIIGAEIITLKYIDSRSFNNDSQSEPSSYNYWIKKKPIMTKSTKVDISEGILMKIDTQGGSETINGIKYFYALKIDLKNKEEKSYTFIYDRIDLEKTTVSNGSSGSAKLKVADLTVGDNIIIKETTDLLRTKNSIITVEIIKK